MKKAIIKKLGKEFEYVRIEDINKKNPFIFIEDRNVDLCKIAVEKLNITTIYTQTSSIDYLKESIFKNVEKLTVDYEVKDMTPTHHLTNLTELNIIQDDNYEINFDVFKKLTSLRCYMPENATNFEKLDTLKTASISFYKKKDLSEFKNLNNLKTLKLDSPNCKTLNGIATLTQLTDLKIIRANNLESVNSIESLNENLVSLEISSKALTDISSIGNLTNLHSLNFNQFDSIDNLSSIGKLKNLKTLYLHNIEKCDSISFLSELKNLKALTIFPWSVKVDDNSYLPLTKKLIELGELKRILQWEDIYPHLDEKGKKIYHDFFGVSKLQFIKNEFSFHGYEDYSEPYTEENCALIDGEIYKLIDELEENTSYSDIEKTKAIKTTVLEINKIDDSIKGFIETGEREYLCDVLDDIALAVSIDIEEYDDGIASEWRTW